MSQEVHILIVEDSEMDYELDIWEMKRTGLQIIAKRVETAEELLEALESFSPEVVLVDYQLPTFDGFTAMALIQKHSPELPLIMVTGVLDEQIAVEAVKAGATDYVTKDRIRRLSGAVQSALQQKHLREDRMWRHNAMLAAYEELDKEVCNRTEELTNSNAALKTALVERLHFETELQKSERRYHDLVESANSIIILWNTEKFVTFINRYGAAFFGYKENEIIGQHVQTIIPETETTGRDLTTLLNEVLRIPGEYKIFINENIRRNGERAWVAWTNRALMNPQGAIREVLSIGNDITQRRKAEELYQEFKLLIEQTPDFIAHLDCELRYRYINPMAEKIMECPMNDVIGKTIDEVGLTYGSELTKKLKDHCNRAIETKDESKFETSISFFNEPNRYQMRIVPEINSAGNVESVMIFARDITKLREAEEFSRQNAALLNTFFEATPVVMEILDENCRYVKVSRSSVDTIGIAESEIIGKYVGDVGPVYIPDRENHLREILATGKPECNVEISGTLPNDPNNVRYWYGSFFPVQLPGGKPGIGVVSVDITEHKHAEDLLHLRENEIRAVVERSPEIIARFDRQFRYIYINPAGERAVNLSRDRIIGKSNEGIGMLPDNIERWNEYLRRAFDTQSEQVMEYSYPQPEGLRWYRSHLVPECNGNNEPISVLSIIDDITDLKQALNSVHRKNEELDRMNKRLEEMVRLKTEFVSIASHELRSPITSIVAFAQTLLTEDQVFSYEERRHFLEIIESEGRRLGNLLGHILDLSRIESGKIGVTKGSFDINQLVLRTIETIRIPQGITITQSIPKTETIVCADSDRIKQVLTNIIDNAIKYSRGSIDIKVISENNWVVISIADNGMGIQPEEIDRIFEPFFQSRKKGNPKGTGLGLAISRGIIEAHGGSMWVESKLDKGSTFLFKLPKGSDCSE